MIENILNGKEQSKIVLIKDTLEQSAWPLATCYLKSLSNRFDQIHLLCFDIPPKMFKNVLPEETLLHCTFHDFSCDPLGWLDNGHLSVKDTDILSYLQKDPILSNSHSQGQQVAVMLCSLTNLIIHRSPSYTCRLLKRLTDTHTPPFAGVTVGQVVSLVHSDLHSDQLLSHLGFVASSEITLQNSFSSDTTLNCHIRHHRTTGKILQIKEQFRLSPNFELKDVIEQKSAAVHLTTDDNQPDPTANLTFNLNLTDKEKKDRSRQVLPHIKIQNTPQEDETKSGGGGQIFYEPDDADDFDEEDPDDDLDI